MAQKKQASKGKKKTPNKPSSKRYKKYNVEGDSIKRAKQCPRCGPGIFLLEADNRIYCGKCHYSEFKTSKDKQKAEQ
ncbi:MAG: 30S ribosomal protein S27ae [Candidatus Pacearchaeota archaeon]